MIKMILGKEERIDLDNVTAYEIRLVTAGSYLLEKAKGLDHKTAMKVAIKKTVAILENY